MTTETRFMQVNQANHNIMYVSVNDPNKKNNTSQSKKNNVVEIDKIRKPDINQNKYLKNFIDCKPVKDKLKEINFMNDDADNIGNLKVNYLFLFHNFQKFFNFYFSL